MKIAILLAAATALYAQAPPATAPNTASVSGVVFDAVTGQPITEGEVFVTNSSPQIRSKTDENGRYTLAGVPPGQRRLAAYSAHQGQMGFGPWEYKFVEVIAGQDLTGIDFKLRPFAQISGKVVDDNKEPVADALVCLVAREYRGGALRHVLAGQSRTDDQGRYTLGRIMPDRGYLVMARGSNSFVRGPISDAPADPRLRKRAVAPVFYPDSPNVEGGQAITLRSGEQRDGVDLRLRRTPSYCLEGVLEGNNGPAALSFAIGDQQASNGRSGDGGFYSAQPGATTAADGKFRVCQLYPGQYTFTARRFAPMGTGPSAPAFFGAATVVIADKDVTNLHLQALPPLSVPGEVVLEGDQPATPAEAKLRVVVQSITEAGSVPWAASSIPGQFSLDGLVMDDYDLDVLNLPPGYYVKDITYGTASVFNRPFRPGSAQNNSVRLIVGRDGGNLSVAVSDKNGSPIAGAHVIVLPQTAATDPDFAALTVTGHTSQNGVWNSAALRPGKRFVLASATDNDNTPESISRLQSLRAKAKEVEIAPGQTVRIALEMPTN